MSPVAALASSLSARATPRGVLPRVHLAARSPRKHVAAQVRSGAWVRVRPGAFVERTYLHGAVGGTPPPRAVVGHRTALAHVAAVIAQSRSWQARGASEDLVLSHESAALVWGLPVWRTPRVTHLNVSHSRSALAATDVVRHVRTIAPTSLIDMGGFWITDLEQTVLDVACSRPAADGLVVADAALRAGADAEELRRLVASAAGRRGVVRARELVELADGGAESAWESFTRLHALAYGLPAPTTQLAIASRMGDFRADVGWEELRLLLEFDGLVKYTALAGGDPGRVVFEEKRREDAIVELGWHLLRLTRDDFHPVDALFDRFDRALTAAARRTLTPRPHLLAPGPPTTRRIG
ncbi:hypothetical protein GCM10011331_20240 [Flavimobilis marinus]|uniref:hypothetical protein n=1 Tax=Flavimobilis marinus TaxID=285351 RepID=UPI000AF004C9|nr:hypothetical protein [Flavimobilis marinus]GHG54440.1 hypothetical protein GCM10011331_20240 [Flavimobilis marinus]